MSEESPLHVVTSVAQLRAAVADLRRAGRTIGLVPTMGALHEGHISLVRASIDEGHATIATIFVNPTQFGPREDLAKYPRTLERDLDLLGAAGVAVAFVPTVDEVYPQGFATYVEPPEAAGPLEGERRPGHFRGVCTVVLKLFLMATPDVAFFGRKDFQQALVIGRMTRDLDVPVDVRIQPTLREADGLAMSSRNVYLSPEERTRALSLSRSLRATVDAYRAGERSIARLEEILRRDLTAAVDSIDYAVLVEPETLSAGDEAHDRTVALLAVRVGSTRLIDNAVLGEEFG
jgi:pantoate--beta-alanine ligase